MGVRATGTNVDVGDELALKNWIDQAVSELGGLDVVVANVSALAGDDSAAAWRNAFDIDMMGTIHTIDGA